MTRPVLSLADIDAFDPQGPPHRKWCPLCGEGKPRDGAHRSLSIERGTGLWKCFRCGASGQAKEFWTDKPAPSSRQAQRVALRAAFDLPSPQLTNAVSEPFKAALSPEKAAPALQPITDWKTRWEGAQSLEGTAGASYLQNRGLSLAACDAAEVRFHPNWSGHSAVVFPIRARDNHILAAQARAVRGDAKLTAGPKKEGAFFAPVTMSSGRVCGPLDPAVPAIVLVEAPIDALSLATCGFPALALCGTSGPSWLHLACGLRRVALAFDADEAGYRAATDIAARLQPFGARCERLRPEGFKDWNEWLVGGGEEELRDWLAKQVLTE